MGGWGSRSPKGSSIPGTTRTRILTGQENGNLNGSPSLELSNTPERGLCRTEMFGGTRQPKRRRRRKKKNRKWWQKEKKPEDDELIEVPIAIDGVSRERPVKTTSLRKEPEDVWPRKKRSDITALIEVR